MAKEDTLAQDYELKKPKHVRLTPIIKKIFNELTSLYPNVYLGGSTMHSLLSLSLSNEPLNEQPELLDKKKDFDFLALGEATNRLNEELKFHTCSY